MKRTIIITSSVFAALVAALLVVIIVLSTTYTKVNFKIEQPSTLSVYNKSYSPTKFNSKATEIVIERLNSAMKKTKLSQIVSGEKLNKYVRDGKDASEYDATLKENNICLEFEYDTIQKVVVSDGTNTRVVKFKYLFVVLDEKSGVTDHVFYYGIYRSDYKTNTPFIVSLNDTSAIEKINSELKK